MQLNKEYFVTRATGLQNEVKLTTDKLRVLQGQLGENMHFISTFETTTTEDLSLSPDFLKGQRRKPSKSAPESGAKARKDASKTKSKPRPSTKNTK